MTVQELYDLCVKQNAQDFEINLYVVVNDDWYNYEGPVGDVDITKGVVVLSAEAE